MSKKNKVNELKEKYNIGLTGSLTTHEMANLCEVTSSTIIEWIKRGKIKCTRTLGGHRRIPVSEYERITSEMNSEETPKTDNKKKVVKKAVKKSGSLKDKTSSTVAKNQPKTK